MTIGYLNSKLGGTPWLESLLGENLKQLSAFSYYHGCSYIAAWGHKKTAAKAMRLATETNTPYLALEDGFLRSYGLGVHGAPLHSLIMDDMGIYYDARQASRLEALISGTTLNADKTARARSLIDGLKSHQLTKYSTGHSLPAHLAELRQAVLVVDQTYGDCSITSGLADEQSFRHLLRTAIKNHPNCLILVKTHPDVVAGKKRGYLTDIAREKNFMLIDEDISPWALFHLVTDVYVVTSQLGFEALLAGKRVHCFGMPFYAGWGLTIDQQATHRRCVSKSLEELVFAAYLNYCRYINPYTGERCECEDTIRLIATQKAHTERYSGLWKGVGFSPLKQRYMTSFLGRRAKLQCRGKPSKSVFRTLVWASKADVLGVTDSDKNSGKLYQIEDGFLRSVGLGVDLVRPLSLVIDSRGIYYDATRSSDLEYLLEHQPADKSLLARARALRKALIELDLTKYNVGSEGSLALPENQTIVLVPGQVEGDMSLRKGSPRVKTDAQLLRKVREARPNAFIVYKPHPDVVTGGRKEGEPVSEALYDRKVTDLSITSLFKCADEVHTMTSLTGFEALLRGIPVVTWGLPFYAGWGLTTDHESTPRRTRALTLDELVASSLIRYPTYVDPKSGDIIDVETAVTLIAQRREQGYKEGLRHKLWKKLRRAR